MVLREYLAKKWVHSVVVIVLIAAIIGPTVTDFVPTIDRRILGLVPIIAWSFGLQYERNVILVSGLVDKEELLEAEREVRNFWGG